MEVGVREGNTWFSESCVPSCEKKQPLGRRCSSVLAGEVLGVGVPDWPTQEKKQGERKGPGGGMISSLVEVQFCSIVLSSVLEETSRKALYVFCGSKMSSSQTPESLPL